MPYILLGCCEVGKHSTYPFFSRVAILNFLRERLDLLSEFRVKTEPTLQVNVGFIIGVGKSLRTLKRRTLQGVRSVIPWIP